MQHRSLPSRSAGRPAPLARVLTFVAAVLAMLVASAASTAVAQATTETFGLVGPVASVSSYQTYEPQDEEPRIRREWTFSQDGVLTGRAFYSYDFMDGSLKYRQESTYENGRAMGSENVDPDGNVVGRATEEYDGQGRRIRSTSFDETGTETRRTEWIYDGAGNLEVRETYRDGELVDRDEYEYDGQGRRIAAREFDGEGNLTSETTYTVPDLEYEIVEYEDDGSIEERSVVVQGEHGVLSAETYLPDGTLENATYFVYDENGLALERRDVYTYESMGSAVTEESTTVYEYEFDDVGNWIRKVDVEDIGAVPAPVALEVREIRYY